MTDHFIDLPLLAAESIETVELIVDLPTDGITTGSIRFVLEDDTLYVYDGSTWVSQGGGGGGGSGTVTQVNTGTGLTGGPITTTGTVSLADTAVTPSSYGSATQVGSFTVDQQGRLTAASNTTIAIPSSALTSVVPVAKGGTNSSAALNNNRVMQSSAGAIVEAAAITASRALASDSNGIPVAATTTTTELNYVAGVTSAIQTQLNAKQATITGAATTIVSSDLAASRAVVSDGSGKVAAATTTSTEIGYVNGVTSAIQTQLNAKQATITGAATTITSSDLTVSRAVVSDGSGKVAAATTTATEIGYVNGVTSAIQTQLNAKQASGNYVTALTGDVTATGPGSVAATIAVGAVTDAKGSLANKPAVTVVATTNQALTGTPTIDGQATAVGSIILLTAQSAGAENGPWVAAAGAWARPSWYASGNTTQAFQFITTLVRLGTVYGGSTWRQTAAAPITIDTTATTWVVTPVSAGGLNSNQKVASFGTTIDGGGSAITTGIKGDIEVPYAGTITGWTLLGDQTGSIVIDVWKTTYSAYPPTVSNTITGADLPTITAAVKGQNLSLSSWTTTVTAGDVIRFNVNSCSSITRATLVVRMTRT